MSGDSRTASIMGREPTLSLMEKSMSGSGRTARSTGREPTLILMEKSMSGDSRTANFGVELFTTNTGMWKAPIQMVFGKQDRVEFVIAQIHSRHGPEEE
jgi:hypothetical protein